MLITIMCVCVHLINYTIYAVYMNKLYKILDDIKYIYIYFIYTYKIRGKYSYHIQYYLHDCLRYVMEHHGITVVYFQKKTCIIMA